MHPDRRKEHQDTDCKKRVIMYIWQHFKTITKHRMLVCRYCFRVGLYWQGLTHDLSKYSWAELSAGCRYWQGNRSPNNAEREDIGVSFSWLHHKGRNKHHFEYWIDYVVGSKTSINGLPMPRKYIAEMVMDRISACRVYMGKKYTDRAPYDYFMKGSRNLWFVHEQVKGHLENLLGMLAEKGEEETLSYIRNVFLKEKDDLYISKKKKQK